ncbi:Aste57867_8866 [Aphanomyces stellatus]|uniref:Aste57867_8866 protein n=1 Tax=Aphanomyces stellatus TaxID=120398 RepID=A0A485KLH6_9STRA|nr:hypothetical protein As57867_008831 [Aphanomyces stellatus]VFT85752.1 Aste57867_8866 [Aphanomyces stellatus]
MQNQEDAHPSMLSYTNEVGQLIFAYQDGIYHDMIPLGRLESIGNYLDVHATITILEKATVVLAPWFATYGTSRLPFLLSRLPHMGITLANYCIFVHDTQVRAFLKTHVPALLLTTRVFLLAVKLSDLEAMEFLVTAGFDQRASCIYSIMDMSVASGMVEIVRFCRDTLLVGVPEAQSTDGSMLIDATTSNYVDIVKLVAPDCTLERVAYSLKVVIYHNHLKVISCLLDRARDEMTPDLHDVLNLSVIEAKWNSFF